LPDGLLGIVVLGSHRFTIGGPAIRTEYTAPPAGANYHRSRPTVRFY
jgi:hypothetical protein